MKLGAGDGSDAIVAKAGIDTVAGLKGHTVAYEKGTPSHFFLLLVLTEAGLTSKDISSRYMTAGDAGAAFVAGNVDACVTWEPWVTTARTKGKGNVLVTSRDKFGVLVDTFVMRNEVLKQRPEDIKNFIRAWFDAIDYWKAHPKESNQIMAKALGIPLEDFVAMLGGVRLSDYEDNRKYFGTKEEPGQYWSVFQAANRIWKAEGIIETAVSPQDYTDTSFLLSIDR
jgi:NitT/TauT family transport system substrate-binding protein